MGSDAHRKVVRRLRKEVKDEEVEDSGMWILWGKGKEV